MRPQKQIILLAFLLIGVSKSFAQDSLRIYPNPFIDSSKIHFNLSQQYKSSLFVFNILGDTVEVIIKDSVLPIGSHSFTFGNSGLPNGVYLVMLKIGTITKSSKVIKMSPTSGIPDKISFKNEVIIFPNPCQGNLNIRFEESISKPMAIYISDPAGRRVYTGIFFDSNIALNLAELQNGLYTLRIPDLGYSTQLILAR
jgi:hypothetical protein